MGGQLLGQVVCLLIDMFVGKCVQGMGSLQEDNVLMGSG